MKKWIIGTLIIVLIGTSMYCATYFWIIPAVAKMMMPFEWNHIPLHQKREVVKSYLGTSITDQMWDVRGDIWVVRKSNYEYTLNVDYSKDTVATNYSIQYQFRNSFFDKTGTLVSKGQ